MKYLLFILLLVVVVITAGCVGGNKETVVTPTPQIIYVTMTVTPTSTVLQAKDPIIGVWRYDTGTQDVRWRFNPDGTYKTSYKSYSATDPEGYGDIGVSIGTWSAQGGNLYIVTREDITGQGVTKRHTETRIYDASRNAIYPPDYPDQVYTRYQGELETPKSTPVSTPTTQPTYSQTSSPQTTHYSGHGDDVKSFTATGSGLRIFTMSHTGSHNFAVVLKDNSGNWVALLANEIGSYSGKKSERLTSGTYYLDIKADGSWTIDISSV
jgi:hypothetical protein